MNDLQSKNKKYENFKLAFLAFIAIFIYAFALLYGSYEAYRDYKNVFTQNYNQSQTFNNDNVVPNNLKNINIKSLNQSGNNTISLFDIENYSVGFIHFQTGSNPTSTAPGDSAILVAFSLEVNANVKYKFDKFYIDSLEYSFTSKFTRTITVDQLLTYEYDFQREVNKKDSFKLSGDASSISDLCLFENINYFIFECNTFMQTGSMFGDNGIVFNNKLSFNDINGGWNINEFSTSPIDGFHDNVKFFSNGSFIKVIHQPSIKSYVKGVYEVTNYNSDKDYQKGYDKGYNDGKDEVLENLPVIDKTAYATTYIWSTITNAVNSVFNVFNVEILPGIPLFALIAIPIVISVLFFVLKVVKK